MMKKVTEPFFDNKIMNTKIVMNIFIFFDLVNYTHSPMRPVYLAVLFKPGFLAVNQL